MNRWFRRAAWALAFLTLGAAAQTIVREAPRDVKPGVIEMSGASAVQVDGKPDRLSPGARIRDTNNLLVLPGSLAGRSVYTVYRREAATGLVHEVWLLTEAEYRKLGGTDAGNPEGYKRFAELLNLIFAARAMGVGK